jgi:hypothetical protein
MHPNVAKACEILDARIARFQWSNYHLTEQAELALNELAAHPNRSDPPEHLVRNALSNARKKLMRREKLMDRFSPMLNYGIDREVRDDTLPELEQHVAAVSAALSESDVRVLETAALTEDSHDLAKVLKLPVKRASERLSRARRRAAQAWKEAA